MGIITQYSRIQHHTLTTSASTFTIPVTEDFTTGTWTKSDLAISEIGVDQASNKAFIRIGNNIEEIGLGGNLFVTGIGSYSIKVDNPSGLLANGNYSFAIGESNQAIGANSFVGGFDSIASGKTSFVFGNSSVATTGSTMVLGDGITGTKVNTLYTSSLEMANPLGYVLLNRITTTNRNALTPENGMIIYNTTDNKFQGYENGSWVSFVTI